MQHSPNDMPRIARAYIRFSRETGGRNAVESDAGCSGQPLPENLRGAADLVRGLYESDEGTEAHVEAIDAAKSIRATGCGGIS